MIIDTHSHIFSEEFDNDLPEVVARAKAAGVEKILLPNIDPDSVAALHAVSDRYSDYCLPMMGLHPTSVTADWQLQLDEIKKYFDQRKYVAVGEIGIDLYWDKSLLDEQQQAFEEQLRWSIEYDLPVSIHSRDAIAECIVGVKKVGAGKLRGVFHSFGGSEDELNEILSLGNFLVGINGVVTFKKTTLPQVLTTTGLDNIVIETDAPYLTPMPYRGKRNEPAYTAYIVTKLSEAFGVSRQEVETITTANAKRMFDLK